MIYLDNASTTLKKPEEVYRALDNANRNLAFNAGRGEYSESSEAFNLIEDTRNKIASLVGLGKNRVVFTASATESLNMIINGLDFQKEDNVYISPFEHNAVVRPIMMLKDRIGFNVELLPFKNDYSIDLQDLKNIFDIKKPKAVFVSHVSNVCGFVSPYESIFELVHKYDALTILDCAQSFGTLIPNIKNVDYTVFAGHKSLYASFGVAGFIVNTDKKLKLYKAGGTGSDSLNHEMPSELPYCYECGSPNIVAIAGLNASLDWLKTVNIEKHERDMMAYLLPKLNGFKHLHLYTNPNQFGVLSLNMDPYSSDELGSILHDDFGICARSGYHCAPFVHDFIESKKYNGTVRISLSYFTTKDDVDSLIVALKELDDEL